MSGCFSSRSTISFFITVVEFTEIFSQGRLDVNLPVLALTDFDGIDVKVIPNNYEICTDRFYSNRYKIEYVYHDVYIDFDDTLVFNRKVYNPLMFAFLYQCINEGKNVFLITRHAYNILETLDNLHIDKRIFTDVIQVSDGKKKSDYIRNPEISILVDNSFAERKNVKETLGIPAFDVCNIDVLLKAPI